MTQATMVPVPEMKLEVVPLPVADVDRAIAFYVEQVGFVLDYDVREDGGVRIVQLTPPGSACSLMMGTGLGEMSEMAPGSVRGLHLVVADVNEAHAALTKRGVGLSEVIVYVQGIKMASFSDPDGNSWTLQELPS